MRIRRLQKNLKGKFQDSIVNYKQINNFRYFEVADSADMDD